MYNKYLGQRSFEKDAERLIAEMMSITLPPGATSGGFGKILTIHANDGGVEVFAVTAAGLTAALAAASSGDAVWIPPCTLVGNWTVPAGVGVQAYGKKANLQSTLTGTVTLGAGAFLNSVYVNPSVSSGSAFAGVIGPASGTAYLNDCSIIVTNTGAGNAYGVQGGAGTLWIWNCYIYGNATGGGSGYGIYEGAGVINVEGGWLRGSTAPISGGSSGYTIGSEISTSAITVTAESGNEISGLTVGNWYAVEATGGPWNNGAVPPDLLYSFMLSNNGGSSWSSTIDVSNSNLPAWAAFREDVDANHVRVYFQATTTSIRIKVADCVGCHYNNTGSLSWKLSNASPPTSTIITNAVRLDPVSGEPAQGDRSAWDALNYQNRHTNDIDNFFGIHWTKATLDATYGSINLGWFNVKDYGAVGDGVTDDTAAINNTIAAIPAAGGVLYFPPGTYLSSGGFNLSVPITVLGCGRGDGLLDNAVTKVICTSATATLFTVASFGCSFQNIALINTASSTPSAGAGITVTSGDRTLYFSLAIRGFYINHDIQDGGEQRLYDCWSISPVLYALKFRHIDNVDWGGLFITNSGFYSETYNANAGIRIESGGGILLSGIAINSWGSAHKFVNGIDLAAAGGVATGVFNIANSGIENFTGNGIKFATSSSAWGTVWITGVEIAQYGGTANYAISITAANLGEINRVILNDLICLTTGSSPGAAISLTKVNNGIIGNVVLTGYTSTVTQSGCTNIVINTSHDAVTVSDTATVDLTLSTQALSADVIPGGIKLDDLGTPDDNTDLNASTVRHGLLPKLSGIITEFLSGDGTWVTVSTGSSEILLDDDGAILTDDDDDYLYESG